MPGFYDSFQQGQRNALLRQSVEQENATRAQTVQQNQQGTDAKQTLAEIEWALQAPDPVQAVRSLPHIAQAWQQHGIDLNTLDPEHARTILQEGQRRAASQLGIGPAQQPVQPPAVDNPGPASIQEWKAFQAMSPAEKKQYLEMKRSPQTFLPTIAGVSTMVQPQSGGAPPTVQPLSTLPAEANAAGTIAGAKAAAEKTAGSTAEAQIDLPGNLADIQKMRDNVNGLISSPGFSTIYGLRGTLGPTNYIPGTEAANSEARRKQLESQAFGISIQKMRGLGQLSNAEGLKVTQAYTRAIDKSQSPESAAVAWREVLGYLDVAERTAKQKAGINSEKRLSPAEASQLPQGATFIGLDGKRYTRN